MLKFCWKLRFQVPTIMTTLPFETETPDEEFRLWTAMPLGHQGAGAVSLGERDLE